MIYDFTSWQQWTGDNAKYFDKCTQSSAQSITIYTIAYPTATVYVTGAADLDNNVLEPASCWPKIVWTPFKYLAGYNPMENLISYLATRQ